MSATHPAPQPAGVGPEGLPSGSAPAGPMRCYICECELDPARPMPFGLEIDFYLNNGRRVRPNLTLTRLNCGSTLCLNASAAALRQAISAVMDIFAPLAGDTDSHV